jgi:hypothetical protein
MGPMKKLMTNISYAKEGVSSWFSQIGFEIRPTACRLQLHGVSWRWLWRMRNHDGHLLKFLRLAHCVWA